MTAEWISDWWDRVLTFVTTLMVGTAQIEYPGVHALLPLELEYADPTI